MPTTDVLGIPLHVEDSGGGLPTAVFLHGFLFDGRQYAAQIEALRSEYRCITVDLPGQGRSGPSPFGYATDRVTDIVIGFLDQLQAGPVHLAGLSMGGFSAMRIAVRRPELVATLALLNTSARAHAPSKFGKQLALAAVARAAGTSLRPIAAGIEEEMYGEAFRRDPDTEHIRSIWRQRWAAADRASLVATLLGFMRRSDFRGQLGRVAAPTLVVAGGSDSSLPPVQSLEIHEGVPGAQLVVLRGIGHSAPIEAPAAVTDALRVFWSRA